MKGLKIGVRVLPLWTVDMMHAWFWALAGGFEDIVHGGHGSRHVYFSHVDND